MKGLQSFYRSFYGHVFYRHFRRPPDFNNSKFRIQFRVETPKNLFLHVHRNSGTHPCLIHTYDRGSRGNLRRNKNDIMVFDRVFFDFDVDNIKAKKVKKELVELRSHGLTHKKSQQEDLSEKLRNLIINDKISKPAIDEAKDFAVKFEESFGKFPILFFSGCKGCHAYTFFKPTDFKNLNMAITWFAVHTKRSYNYQTLDLSVAQDAVARLSRIPYSKHQLTGLSVVPFTLHDNYEEIMDKTLNPEIENFKKDDYSTEFNKHIQEIDSVESFNAKVKEFNRQRKISISNDSKKVKSITDHKIFFKSILGAPEREYPEKDYAMYNCPFSDHEDKKPSFRVNKKGFYCYGCQRKGNYWQFYKDYYGWDDQNVREHLKI